MSRSNNLLTAFQEYLYINKALEQNTIKSYLGDLRQFQTFFHDKEILKLQTADIFAFLSKYQYSYGENAYTTSSNSG